MNGVTRKTFQGYSVESKLDTLFDYIHEIHQHTGEEISDLKRDVKALKSRKWVHAAASAVGGLLGGAGAVWFWVHNWAQAMASRGGP